MKKWVAAVFVLIAIAFIGFPAQADQPVPEFAPGQILVRFKPGLPIQARDAHLKQFGAWYQSELPEIDVTVAGVREGEELAVIDQLEATDPVVYAEVNGLVFAVEAIPNDPRWSEQYGPVRIKGPQAWDLSTGSSIVIISVIDTGVACSHEDLTGKCVAGFDFVNNDPDPFDDHGHGRKRRTKFVRCSRGQCPQPDDAFTVQFVFLGFCQQPLIFSQSGSYLEHEICDQPGGDRIINGPTCKEEMEMR